MEDQEKQLVNSKPYTRKCPICHRVAKYKKGDFENTIEVDCTYCGRFMIKGWNRLKCLRETREPIREPDLKMSIVLRHLGRGSSSRIELNVGNYDEIKQSIGIPSNPFDLIDLLMIQCGNKATRFNRTVSIPYSDITLLYIHDEHEMKAMLDMATELGFIGDLKSDNGKYTFTLSIKGLERIAQLREQRSESKRVFVAMKFDDKMLDEAYQKAIVPSVERCGYHALRVDKVPHNDKICDRIISEIKQSAFVIADFTGHRGGVYFEAGYALGLGIPVIFTCHEDDFGDLHFDTRQYNHIKWNSNQRLLEELEDRIMATIVKR